MRVQGLTSEFAYHKEDGSRNVYGYGLTPIGNDNALWYEFVFYKKINPNPTIEQIKEVIKGEINEQTDKKILSGFVWNDIPVWLSEENQMNFKAAYDLAFQSGGATLPVTFKLGEDGQGEPIYYEFTNMNDFSDFYMKAVAYIQQCLSDGWAEKDSIDWSVYEPLLQQATNE